MGVAMLQVTKCCGHSEQGRKARVVARGCLGQVAIELSPKEGETKMGGNRGGGICAFKRSHGRGGNGV